MKPNVRCTAVFCWWEVDFCFTALGSFFSIASSIKCLRLSAASWRVWTSSHDQRCVCVFQNKNLIQFFLVCFSAVYCTVMCSLTGHGSSAHSVEGWSGAGVFGHHTGIVDSPARVAAFRRPDAPRASRFCVVNPRCLNNVNSVCI